MFIKLAVSFLVVSLLAEVNGSPFGQLFDVVQKPAEIAKDTVQQPLQPILGAFGAPLNRKSRAAQSDSSSGSPAGLFDIVKKPAEVVKDAFEKPIQPLLGAFGAPLNRQSRQAENSDSKKKDDKKKDDDDDKQNDDKKEADKKKKGQQSFKPIFDLFNSQVDKVYGAADDSDSKKKDDKKKDDDDKQNDDKKDTDKKKEGQEPLKPILDLFNSQANRVYGAFSALLSPGNKQ